MHPVSTLLYKERSDGHRDLGDISTLAWAKSGRTPLCLSEQLINPDSGHHSWDSELPAVLQAVPGFPNGHQLVQSHPMDPGKGLLLLAALLRAGMGMPCFGQRRLCKTVSPLYFSLFTLGMVFQIPPTPTPLPLTTILEMSGPIGMERCSLSFCPSNPGSIFCVDKNLHLLSCELYVVFSLYQTWAYEAKSL